MDCPKCGTYNGPSRKACRKCDALLVDQSVNAVPDLASLTSAAMPAGLKSATTAAVLLALGALGTQNAFLSMRLAYEYGISFSLFSPTTLSAIAMVVGAALGVSNLLGAGWLIAYRIPSSSLLLALAGVATGLQQLVGYNSTVVWIVGGIAQPFLFSLAFFPLVTAWLRARQDSVSMVRGVALGVAAYYFGPTIASLIVSEMGFIGWTWLLTLMLLAAGGLLHYSSSASTKANWTLRQY